LVKNQKAKLSNPMDMDFLNWGWAQRTSLMQLTEDGSGVPMGNSSE
jgi:hypothetical protein